MHSEVQTERERERKREIEKGREGETERGVNRKKTNMTHIDK